jgi:predicted NodU family carbamoyl transferase
LDGKILVALEEERINRTKHWAGFPALAIRKCLESQRINNINVDSTTQGQAEQTKMTSVNVKNMSNSIAGFV